MEKEKINELFELLVSSGSTIITKENGFVYPKCYANSCSYYLFNKDGYYVSFGLNIKKEKERILDNVIRVEKTIDGETYPIWTIEDGIVKDFEHFVRIKGKYYTVAQLERIFDEFEELKVRMNRIHIV